MGMMRCFRSICIALLLSKCTAFVVSPENRSGGSIRRFRRHDRGFFPSVSSFPSKSGSVRVITAMVATDDTAMSSSEVNGSDETLFPNAEFLEFILSPHRPLGCTVEESLADTRHIFVTKVTGEGYAEQAGLLPGDVIVGVSDLFGILAPVTGLGIDKVKGFVGSRPEDEPLQIRVARGTAVAEDHERALVDLCANPGASDQETEQCVIDFLVGGYTLLDDEEDNSCDDGESECLIDNMWADWAEDLAPTNGAAAASDQSTPDQNPPKPKVKPWSSRVSSSGTFVRDPVTGKMTNIDE